MSGLTALATRRPSRKLGVRAVPALIDAITNTTPTRCVYFSFYKGDSFWGHTVGQFAEDLLEEFGEVELYGLAQERQAEWRDWWEKRPIE